MIPYHDISPEIFRIGPIAIRWYGLMYVFGYVVGFLLLKWRVRRGLFPTNYLQASNLIQYLIIGMIIGARIAYVIFYDFSAYSIGDKGLLDVFKVWQGGLSFHGAITGMVAASLIYSWKYKIDFFLVTDAIAFCGTLGIFFGRMGNFINGELWGRVTSIPWGMNFPKSGDQLARHPSQLYEAFGEGVFIFLVIYFIQMRLVKKKVYKPGVLGIIFLVLYGAVRFVVEFFRQPDEQLGFVVGSLSMGQLLCVAMVILGGLIYWLFLDKKEVFIPRVPKLSEIEEN